MPGTYYDFSVNPDPDFGASTSGTGTYTLGPRLIIEVNDIEQTTAKVKVSLPTDEQDHGERDVHLVYYKMEDEQDSKLSSLQVKPTPQKTVDYTTTFDLSNLTAGTDYKVKASLSSAFPTHHTERKEFPTVPGKPTGVTLAPDDEKLDVSWTKPAGGDAINFYTVEWQAKADIDAGTGSPSFSSAIAVTDTTYEITGLTNGTEYGVRVTASNNSGHADSDYAYATPAGLPSAPKNLSVTPGNKQLTLSWQEPDELGGVITGYEVQYKEADDSSAVWATSSATVASETDAQSNVTTYSTTITGLDFSTKYDVRVRAKNSITETDEEDYNWATSTGTTLPDVPTELKSEPGNQRLTLSWEEPTNLGTVAISNYVVQYRKTSETGWTPSSAANEESTDSQTSVTTYSNTITGLDHSTDYDLRVRADNDVTLQDGEGYNWAVFDGQTIPGSPGNLQVVPGDEQLTLTWEAPANSGSLSITGYAVQYKKADDSTAVWAISSATIASDTDALTNVTTYSTTISSLDFSTKYEVRVRAKNSITKTDEEDYNWATSTGTTLPDVPTELKSEPGNQRLTLSWKEPADLGSVTISDYVVQYRKTSDTGWSTSSAANEESTDSETSVTTYSNTITGLDHSTDYDLRVRADNGVTLQDEEGYNWAIGDGQTIPGSPVNFEVVPGDEQLTLSWEAPADSGSLIITGYAVQYKKTADSSWSSLSALSASTLEKTISSLENDVRYSVRVRAVNIATLDDDEGYNWATDDDSTPDAIPGVPKSFDIVEGDTEIEITWEEPDNDGSAITGYRLQWKLSTTADWASPLGSQLLADDELTYTIGSLENGTEYSVRVRAVNDVVFDDEDDYGWSKDEGTPSTTPGAPTLDTVTAGPEKLTAEWTEPTDTGGAAIEGYKVQWKADTVTDWDAQTGVSEASVGASVLSHEITGLTNGTTYDVRVIASNKNGDGVESNELPGTPRPEPTVTDVTVADASITQTGATAAVAIDNKTGESQTVHLGHRINTSGSPWTYEPTKTVSSTDTSVDFELSDLEGNTEHLVEAWLAVTPGTKGSATFTTGAVPPGVPTNTAVTPGNTIINLEWDPPTEDGGATVTHYVIQWDEYDTQDWDSPQGDVTITDEEYEITGLTNGTRYAVRVRADNLAPKIPGKSYNWVFGGGTPRTIPAAPTVTVTPDNAKLHVEWNEPADGGNAISGYVVEYSDDDKATWKSHGEPGSNTFETTIPNLENGTKYFVQVRAKNNAVPDTPGVFNWGEHYGTPRTIPAEPEITVAPGDTVLVVSWDEPDNGGSDITGHVVQYKENTDDGWETSTATIAAETDTDTEVTSYETTIISLENGTLYDVRVRAVNVVMLDDDGDYEWGKGSGKPRTIPEEPVVGVTPGNAQLVVTWNKPANGGDDITGFVVQYMKDTDTGWSDHSTPGKDATSTTISSLENGEMYTVRVRAVNTVELDDEENYNWGENSGKPRTIPNVPDSLTVTHGNQQLTATWTQPTGTGSNGGDTITGYEVQWKEKTSTGWSSRSSQLVTGIDTLTLTFSQHSGQSLANGTTYSVRVRAINTVELDDEGDYNWRDGEETPSTTPDAPEKVRISNQGDKELTVKWDAPVTTGGDDISGYVVQWRAKGIANWEATSTTEDDTIAADKFSHTFTQHLSTDLGNGVSYEARVIAKNRNGRGTPSVHVEGKPRTTPNSPDDLEATEGDTELALTWTAPTETGGVNITIDYYIVEYKKDGENSFKPEQTTDASTNLTLDGLENGKLYTIRVKAHNSEGDTSEPSGTTTGKPRTIPGKPDITAVTAGNGTLTVAWTPPTDNGGADPTKYILEWEKWIEATTTWQSSGSQEDTNGSPSEIAGLTNGTKYRVEVKAHNAAGTGPASDPVERTPKTIPDAPVLTLTPGDGELNVKWTEPGDGGDAITDHVVQYMKNTDTDWTPISASISEETDSQTEITAYETTISGLDNGHEYTVRVRAVNTAEPDAGKVYNWGKASDIPRTFPAAPSVNLVHGKNQLKVTWDKPDKRGADITGFVVQYKKAADKTWGEHSRPDADKTTTDITGLDNGVLYDVRVRAVNSVTLDDEEGYEWGEDSEIPRRIPGFVTGLGIISGDEELTVSWVAPTVENNGGAAVKGYVLQWKSGNEEYDPSSDRHTTTTDVSKVLEPLSNGILYSIRVRADNGETADIYNWVEETGTPMSVPGAPTGLDVEEGDEQLKVTWVAPEETGGEGVEIERYVIQWKLETASNWPSQNEHTTTDETVLTDTITGLLNGEMYDIRVRADNNVEGQTFQWGNTTGTPRTIPSEPRSLSVTAGDSQLSLTWDTPAETGGLNINQYVVQWKSGVQEYNNTDRQDTTSNRSYVIRGLTNDVLHTLRVRADNTVTVPDEENYNWEAGTGTPAAAANPPQPPQQPDPPQQPNPPANINPPQQRTPVPSVSGVTFANISQTAADATVSLSDAGSSQKTVRLRYREDGTTRWTTVPANKTNGASTTISLTGLTAGTTYEVQAWLTTNSPPSGTQIYEFTTLVEVVSEPSISALECENVGQTFATAMVKIANAGTDMKEIYLKHSMDGVDSWTMLPSPSVTYTDSTFINLTGLQVGTTYEVAVALTNDFDGMLTCSFTTLASDPSVSGIGISDITNTSAVATVNIASPGTAQKTVHLRYRVFGETEWGSVQTKRTTGSSAQFSLTALSPRTTYEVQASLANDFSASRSVMFTTSTPDPSVSSVSVSDITDTSAVASVGIAYAGSSQKTVHLRHRVFGETEWGTAQTETTSGSSAQFDLTGLEPQTKYEVEASLSRDFTESKTATFTTLVPDPSVSALSIGSIRQVSAVATIAIADAGEAQKTVHLRYRVEGTGEWSGPALTATTYGASLSIDLTGLTPDTDYEVQVSLDGSFAAFASTTFKTLRYPSLSDIDVTDITKTTATAEIDIADPDGSNQMVHLRYRTTTPQGSWSNVQKTTSTKADASIMLTGLVTDTEYEVQASLTSDFAVPVSDTFKTLPPDPVVSGVSVIGIAQTTATANIDITNSDGSSQTVSLRYRTTTPRGDWSGTLTTTSSTDSASIDLAGLAPGTEYDVQASLDDTFPAARTKYDTFTTLRHPSIATLEAQNIGRNGTTVVATLADSRGESQTVYVRHRQARYIVWRTTQQTDSVDDIASLRLRGLSSGTEYIAEASLDSSFPDGEIRSVTFTTKERRDDDDTPVVVQEARAVTVPLLGFSPQMLRFVAIEGGESPAPQTFSVWNRAQGTMDFILSNQQEWLSQEPTSGTSGGPADPVTITVSVDSAELASGQYVDIISIDVSASGRSPDQVVVVLDVLPPDYVRQFVSRDEGGTVILPDGTVKIVVQPLSPPKDVDIELMKLNLQAHGAPPGNQQRVVVAIESSTYPPGGDTPEDVAYLPYVTLWVQVPHTDAVACAEGRVRLYSVQRNWSLEAHSCETDESGDVWAVADVERLGAFALVIDDSPATPMPTPAAAAMATPTGSVISDATSATVRTSLPALPPTPVPTAVPTALPAPVGQPVATPETIHTPTATAVPATVEPSAPAMQASVELDGSGGMNGVILAAIGLPMLLGALLLGYLIYRERRRRNGNHI